MLGHVRDPFHHHTEAGRAPRALAQPESGRSAWHQTQGSSAPQPHSPPAKRPPAHDLGAAAHQGPAGTVRPLFSAPALPPQPHPAVVAAAASRPEAVHAPAVATRPPLTAPPAVADHTASGPAGLYGTWPTNALQQNASPTNAQQQRGPLAGHWDHGGGAGSSGGTGAAASVVAPFAPAAGGWGGPGDEVSSTAAVRGGKAGAGIFPLHSPLPRLARRSEPGGVDKWRDYGG